MQNITAPKSGPWQPTLFGKDDPNFWLYKFESGVPGLMVMLGQNKEFTVTCYAWATGAMYRAHPRKPIGIFEQKWPQIHFERSYKLRNNRIQDYRYVCPEFNPNSFHAQLDLAAFSRDRLNDVRAEWEGFGLTTEMELRILYGMSLPPRTKDDALQYLEVIAPGVTTQKPWWLSLEDMVQLSRETVSPTAPDAQSGTRFRKALEARWRELHPNRESFERVATFVQLMPAYNRRTFELLVAAAPLDLYMYLRHLPKLAEAYKQPRPSMRDGHPGRDALRTIEAFQKQPDAELAG